MCFAEVARGFRQLLRRGGMLSVQVLAFSGCSYDWKDHGSDAATTLSSSSASGSDGSSGSEASTGGGGSTACHPGGADGLYDPFDGSELGNKWVQRVSGGAAIRVGDGVLGLDLPAQATAIAAIESAATYDLTDCSVLIRVLGVPAQDTGARVQLKVEETFEKFVDISVSTSTLVSEIQVPTNGNSVILDYDPAEHVFWRIREAVGRIYMEASPDAQRWSVLQEVDSPLQVSAVTIKIEAEIGVASEQLPGSAQIDGVNVLP